jgi:hypothetical protein
MAKINIVTRVGWVPRVLFSHCCKELILCKMLGGGTSMGRIARRRGSRNRGWSCCWRGRFKFRDVLGDLREGRRERRRI